MEPTQTPDPGDPAAPPDDFVQSVGRAMRVLEVVSSHPALPVKSIARRCALNISTTYHLVRTLAYEGYLVRLPDGTYVIGDAVARRYHELVSSLARPPDSGTVLRHLSERVGLSAYLGLLHDGRVTVVEVIEGVGSPYLEDFEVGLDVSAHATALGKALLAAMPRRERHDLLSQHELRRFTANTAHGPRAARPRARHRGDRVSGGRARGVPRRCGLRGRRGAEAAPGGADVGGRCRDTGRGRARPGLLAGGAGRHRPGGRYVWTLTGSSARRDSLPTATPATTSGRPASSSTSGVSPLRAMSPAPATGAVSPATPQAEKTRA